MERKKYGKTAWEIHEMVMREFEVYQRYGEDPVILRVIPTPEQAREYVECVKKLDRYTRRRYLEGMERISPEEMDQLFKQEELFERMALDMRDVIFEEDGNKGLRRVTGEIVVPALFDGFPERYDVIFQLEFGIGTIPVIRNNKYALCVMDGSGHLLTDFIFDNIYMYFYGSSTYFVVEHQGKKGLVDSRANEIIPCEMDEIYEQMDTDGIIPYRKSTKWGLLHFGVNTGVVFDDVLISSEDYAQGKIGEEWFYIDGNGKPTRNNREAWFGSWYDSDK